MNQDSVIHFFSGGLGGACGAAVINPLEVVKTRLQSSSSGRAPPKSETQKKVGLSGRFEFWRHPLVFNLNGPLRGPDSSSLKAVNAETASKKPTLRRILGHIVRTEGVLALWKGFGTTLVGVFPSRAIYFCAYSNAKTIFGVVFPAESSAVHTFSAAFAGFCCTTITNPLWMVRTRLQLDRRATGSQLSVSDCINKVYKEFGFKGFYRGVTASYLGIVETALHFTIYERLKRSSFLSEAKKEKSIEVEKAFLGTSDFLRFMICASISRMIAATIGYPHEVLRTRLREENSKYNGLWRTAKQITREETWRALYGGLSVHLLRTVPNTAITMATYELLVVLLTNLVD